MASHPDYPTTWGAAPYKNQYIKSKAVIIKKPEKVCTLINSWKQTYKKPNMKQIKLVASILDISYERYSNNFLNSSSKKDYDIELRRKLLDSIEKQIKK